MGKNSDWIWEKVAQRNRFNFLDDYRLSVVPLIESGTSKIRLKQDGVLCIS
jgi:hypothetical protein